MLYKKILLPIDINEKDSWEKTLPTCASMLRDNPDAQLYILSVIPNFGMSMMEEYFPVGWKKEVSAKTLTELKQIVERHVPQELKPELIVDRGVVYQVLLEHAAKLEIDLIVMAASHPSRKDYLLGPNVAKVARHAEVSVLICR
jgi:nucleotide-binding universal stress UspA family protein